MDVYEVIACMVLIFFFALLTIYVYYITLKPNEAYEYEKRYKELQAINKSIYCKEKLVCDKLLEENIFRHIKGAGLLSLLEALEYLQQINKQIESDQKNFDQYMSRLMMKLKDKTSAQSSLIYINKPTPILKKERAKPILIYNGSGFKEKTEQPQSKKCCQGLMSSSERKLDSFCVSNAIESTQNLKSRKTKPSSIYNVSVFSGKTKQHQSKKCLGLMSPSKKIHERILNTHYKQIRATLRVNKLNRPSKYNLCCHDSTPAMQKNNKQRLKYEQQHLATDGFRKCNLNYFMVIDFLNKKNGSPKVIIQGVNNMSLLKLSDEYGNNINLLGDIEFKIPPHVNKLKLKVPIKTRVLNLVLLLSISLTKGINCKPKLILKSKQIYRKKKLQKCQPQASKIVVADFNTLKKMNPQHSLYTICNMNRLKCLGSFEEIKNSYSLVSQQEKGDCKTIGGPEEKFILTCLNNATETCNVKQILQRYVNLSKKCSTTDFYKGLPQQRQTTMLAVIEDSTEDLLRKFDKDDRQEKKNDNWNVDKFTSKSTELWIPSSIDTKTTINESPLSNYQTQCPNMQFLNKQWENNEDEVESLVIENIKNMSEIKKITLSSFIDLNAFNSTQLIDQPIYYSPSIENCTDSTLQNNIDNSVSLSKNIQQFNLDEYMNSYSVNNLCIENLKTQNTLAKIKVAEDCIVMRQDGPNVMNKQLICTRVSEISYDTGDNSKSDFKPLVVMKGKQQLGRFQAIDQFDID